MVAGPRIGVSGVFFCSLEFLFVVSIYSAGYKYNVEGPGYSEI